MSRFREKAKLLSPIRPNQLIEPDVLEKMQNVTFGDTASALQFMQKYGTHYVNSYTTGNSLYQVRSRHRSSIERMTNFRLISQQVFVFNRRNYLHIKERLKSRGVLSLSRSDLYNFFAPWFAEHLGSVRCSSGNSTVERWASRKLKLSYYLFTYNSLLKIHGSSTLLKSVDDLLRNEAILQLELKSLETAFKDPQRKSWFKIILDNTLKLWETNMS